MGRALVSTGLRDCVVGCSGVGSGAMSQCGTGSLTDDLTFE